MKRSSLAELSSQIFDILVIGGGITGTSAARDAALRGLSVALVEKDDFGSGTSSRSTKLLHGGLRYLEQFEFKLVREACRERELMLKLAPHLAHPRPFVYLLYDGYPESKWKLSAGLTLYDHFSGNPKERRHRMIHTPELLQMEPHLNPNGLKGGGQYFDFLTDDARLTLETAKAACQLGALAANYMAVTSFVIESGRIAGVQVTDKLTGESGEVRARQVINAAGVWADQVRLLEPQVTSRRIRPAKGVHIVLTKADFPLHHAVFLRAPRDHRVVWPIPALQGDLVYVGTTDTDYSDSLDHVTATADDIDYLLEVANQTLPGRNLNRSHVVSTWAGLRPLIRPEGSRSASKTSREHQIMTSPAGLLTIAGGKLTTCRVMGQQVVEHAVQLLGMRGVRASRSDEHPLSGGDMGPDFRPRVAQTAIRLNLPSQTADRIARQYGSNLFGVTSLMEADPDSARQLGAHPLTVAEVRYAVLGEMARTVTDLLERRTSIFYWTRDGGISIAADVAAEMGRLLGWTPAEMTRQVAAHREWVSANRMMVPVP